MNFGNRDDIKKNVTDQRNKTKMGLEFAERIRGLGTISNPSSPKISDTQSNKGGGSSVPQGFVTPRQQGVTPPTPQPSQETPNVVGASVGTSSADSNDHISIPPVTKDSSTDNSVSEPVKVSDTFDSSKLKGRKEYSEAELSDLKTIYDIGSMMSGRSKAGITKTLERIDKFIDVGGGLVYTPVAYNIKDMYKKLGIVNIMGPVGGTAWKDLIYPDESNPTEDPHDIGVGSSIVLNPPFQYNENDDIRSNKYFPNIGRVYNDSIRSNYPIVVFEVGRIVYNKSVLALLQLAAAGANPESAKLKSLIKGDHSILTSGINAVKGILTNALKIVTLPVSKLMKVSNFAKFVNDTTLFTAYVNEILVTIGTQYGVANPWGSGGSSSESVDDIPTFEYDGKDKGIEKLVEEEKKKAEEASTTQENPLSDDDDGITSSYWKVDNTGAKYPGGTMHGEKSKNILNFYHILPNKTAPMAHYIPYMIYSNSSISESISNSTTTNPFSDSVNATAESNAAGDLSNVTGGQNLIDQFGEAFKAKVDKVLSQLGKGETGFVLNGEGRMTLPDIWSNSNFSRTVSLTFKFESPYGDALSIFENTMIPFVPLMVMAMPRQVGQNSYTSPFIIRASSKGWFNISMGIVESLTIERGENKNNWSVNGHPRSIKVSMNIKDLSPIMMMGLHKGKFPSLYSINQGFSSYMTILGGMSVYERDNVASKLNRGFKQVTAKVSNFFHQGNIFQRFLISHSDNFMVKTYTNLVKGGFTNNEDRKRLERY